MIIFYLNILNVNIVDLLLVTNILFIYFLINDIYDLINRHC